MIQKGQEKQTHKRKNTGVFHKNGKIDRHKAKVKHEENKSKLKCRKIDIGVKQEI